MSESRESIVTKGNRRMHEIAKGLGVLALLVLLMLWLSGAFRHKVEPGPPIARAQSETPVFRTQAVEQRAFPLFIEQVGTVRTQGEAKISGRIMAQVTEIYVREGQMATGPEKGADKAAVLARLDDRDMQARIRQAQSQVAGLERAVEAAQANLKAAKAKVEAAKSGSRSSSADYVRYETLYNSRAATGQQLDHARSQKEVADAQMQAAVQAVAAAEGELQRTRAQKDQAEAALAEARVALSHTVVRAPFSGKVIRKMVDVGDTAAPGQPLFIMETPLKPELHALVSESVLPNLQVGQAVEVRIDAIAEDLMGSVYEITPQADPSTRTVTVKVALQPKTELVAGLFGRLRIPLGEYTALVVPAEAVREVGQLQLVDVLDSNRQPQRRFVTLGHRREGLVEVLSGLREGEEVVLR